VEKENPGQLGHNGADEGFQALLTMNSETGKGLAIMADSDNGIAVADLVLRRVAELYAWNYKFGGPPPALVIVAKVRGVQAALDRYVELKKAGDLQGEAAEATLNRLGYTLLYSGQGQEKDAITVFQRNIQEFPASSNVYDSLGEAYMKVGQKDLAIANYEKSLQLNPKNQNAVDRLKKLREQK